MGTNAPRIDALQKNYWIGGSMDFFQRSVGPGNMSNLIAYSGPDRLKTRYQGTWTGVPTIAQDATNVPANLLSLNACLIAGNASNVSSEFDLTTFIESFNARELAGGVLSLGFQSLTGAQTLQLVVSYASVVDNFTTVVPFSTQTIAIPASGSYQQISFANIAVPVQAVNGIQISLAFSNLAVTGSSSNHRFTQFMLNNGPKLASFVRSGGTFAQELILCQRYFEKTNNLGANPGETSQAGSLLTFSRPDGAVQTYAYYKVQKRIAIAPVVYSDTTGTPNKVHCGGADITIAYNSPSTWGCSFGAGTGIGAASAGVTYQYAVDADF